MVNQITLNAYTYGGLIGGGSKLYVPVSPSAVIYTQLDHIHGVAAGANQSGIPVSKIRILNTLIDQLVSMKTHPSVQPTPETAESKIDSKQMDALIKDYQNQIQTAVAAAQATGYGLAGAAPQTGAVFSLSA